MIDYYFITRYYTTTKIVEKKLGSQRKGKKVPGKIRTGCRSPKHIPSILVCARVPTIRYVVPLGTSGRVFPCATPIRPSHPLNAGIIFCHACLGSADAN